MFFNALDGVLRPEQDEKMDKPSLTELNNDCVMLKEERMQYPKSALPSYQRHMSKTGSFMMGLNHKKHIAANNHPHNVEPVSVSVRQIDTLGDQVQKAALKEMEEDDKKKNTGVEAFCVAVCARAIYTVHKVAKLR